MPQWLHKASAKSHSFAVLDCSVEQLVREHAEFTVILILSEEGTGLLWQTRQDSTAQDREAPIYQRESRWTGVLSLTHWLKDYSSWCALCFSYLCGNLLQLCVFHWCNYADSKGLLMYPHNTFLRLADCHFAATSRLQICACFLNPDLILDFGSCHCSCGTICPPLNLSLPVQKSKEMF